MKNIENLNCENCRHLRGRFSQIKKRCLNPNHKSYQQYKNIKIHEPWLKNPMEFVLWAIKEGFKQNLSIDRINSKKGYNPKNCRWTIQTVQAKNQRTPKNNKTGYIGVSVNNTGKYIRYLGSVQKYGFTKTCSESKNVAVARDFFLITNTKKSDGYILNFPQLLEAVRPEVKTKYLADY